MTRAVGAILLLALAAAPVAAQTKPTAKQIAEARQHFAQGQKLHEAGRYEEAVAEYQVAYDLSRRPLLLYNIGQEYRLAGDKRKAIEHYERYLAAEAPGKAVPEARVFISALKREVELEDARMLAEAANQEWHGGVEGATMARPLAAAEPPAGPHDVAPGVDGSRGRALRIGGMVGAGAGVALLGVGTVFALRSRSLSDQQFDADHRFDPTLVDDGKAANRNALICLTAGGVAVVAGGLLYYLGHRQGHEARVSIIPAIAPGFAGLTAAGSY